MSQGPVLIFDKSTLESLSLDEAVLLDNFYMSNITPLFYVECLADLERKMVRMKSTPEQLVGSLAERTPDSQASANVYHLPGAPSFRVLCERVGFHETSPKAFVLCELQQRQGRPSRDVRRWPSLERSQTFSIDV
jgi:hypothetical protein